MTLLRSDPAERAAYMTVGGSVASTAVRQTDIGNRCPSFNNREVITTVSIGSTVWCKRIFNIRVSKDFVWTVATDEWTYTEKLLR